MRIALIASSRYPIAEPFSGGLESHVWHLATALSARGHGVTLFAADGSDPALPVERILPQTPTISSAARADVSMPDERFLLEHHAYLALMVALCGPRAGDFDVVHNHSLHYLPVAMSPGLRRPMLSTLHTPPTPWLESAMQTAGRTPKTARWVAVSRHTARAWAPSVDPIEVVPNGVDLHRWQVGPGGGPLIWFGRIVREKGVDLAIAAARAAGRRLQVAGPIVDRGFFDEAVAPHLGADVRYLGHLDQAALAVAVGAASVCLVSPRWDEPYGLVVAEALACGTPVVAFARGGIPEVVDDRSAVLVPPGDVTAMAAAIPAALALDRAACRRRAVVACSVEAMVDRYEGIYARLLT